MVVVAPCKDLIVTLPVVGREGNTYPRHRGFVTQGEGLTFDTEPPCRQDSGIDVQRQLHLCRIIAVTGVVESAKDKVGKQAHPDIQRLRVDVIVPAITEVISRSQEGIGVAPCSGIRDKSLL